MLTRGSSANLGDSRICLEPLHSCQGIDAKERRGCSSLSHSWYLLKGSVALVPLLGRSSAGGWREATAEPPPASRLAGSSRCECSHREVAATGREAVASRESPAWENARWARPVRAHLPRGSAHIGTWLPPGPEDGGFSLRATGSGGPGTKGAEESGVLAIRGSQPLRKSEYWQWMTPFVCQTLRFPGFQRARIANTRHSSATLGSRGLPIARGRGFRDGNPGPAACLAAGGRGECSREASTARGEEPPLSMNSSPPMACRLAADRATLPFSDF